MVKDKIISHLKGDIKTFKKEAAEDRELIKFMKHKKHGKKHHSEEQEERMEEKLFPGIHKKIKEMKKHEKKKHHSKASPSKKSHVKKAGKKTAIKKAMKHPDVLGAGAKKRRALKNPKDKVETVMAEFKRGTLHSGGGPKVKSRKQAIAIALSEARKAGEKIKPLKRKKK